MTARFNAGRSDDLEGSDKQRSKRCVKQANKISIMLAEGEWYLKRLHLSKPYCFLNEGRMVVSVEFRNDPMENWRRRKRLIPFVQVKVNFVGRLVLIFCGFMFPLPADISRMPCGGGVPEGLTQRSEVLGSVADVLFSPRPLQFFLAVLQDHQTHLLPCETNTKK